MAWTTWTDYGGCPCGGKYTSRQVEVNMTVADAPITLSDVPQGACPNCGSRVYKEVVLAIIESVMRNGPSPWLTA